MLQKQLRKERAGFPPKGGRGRAMTDVRDVFHNDIHVNLNVLDSLVLDYAFSEDLVTVKQCSASPLSSPCSSLSVESSGAVPSEDSQKRKSTRDVIDRIRKLTEEGSIEEVFNLLSSHAPFLLNDHHLLFRLHKQEFIELLRRGSPEARDLAINCCRTTLGPCALNAYPEAYEEFKKVLLAFIYDKDDKNSPVTDEWAEERRSELAALMASTLKAHLRAHDVLFLQTLKYLLSVHNGYCYHQGFVSTIQHVTQKLLFEERDPPASLTECLYEAPHFDEVDVQALAQAVRLPRQAAIDSLRCTSGDVFAAFQNELSRMKLNLQMVDALVHEYCVYRGLLEEAKDQNTIQKDFVSSYGTEHIEGKESNLPTAITDVQMEDSADKCPDDFRKLHMDTQARFLDEPSYSGETCSTSGSCQKPATQISRVSPGMHEEIAGQIRWKGRGWEVNSEISNEIEHSRERESTIMLQVDTKRYYTSDFQTVLAIRELISKGIVKKAVDIIKELHPYFFEKNPILLFKLMQIEFLKLVENGHYTEALAVARSDMGSVALSNPALLKPLKETLLVLANPKESMLVQHISLPALATALQLALGTSIGIEEPMLIKLMRGILYTHIEWFKLQMCTDRFEELLRINELKAVDLPDVTVLQPESRRETLSSATSQETNSSCNWGASDGSSQVMQASRDAILNENAVLQIMEFLALPRSDAIHLLAQYNGNVDAVFQQFFS